MATAITVPPLVPSPSPRPITAWSPRNFMGPALKQLQQSAPSSRSRRERPCDGCRRRKSKCVLQDSRRCVLCEFHKQECTFVENAQPRKRKADDGVKVEPTTKKSPTIARRSPTIRASDQQHLDSRGQPLVQAAQRIGPISSPTSLLPTAEPITVNQPLMRKPFSVDESLSLQRHRHCKYVGHLTGLDSTLIALGHFDEGNETESRVGTLRKVAEHEYFSTHADADVPIPDDEARALAEIEQVVGPHGPALVDLYFRKVHPSFPVIHKEAFLDRHEYGDRQFNPPLLAAMYLLALAWWDHDPSLSITTKPDASRLEYIAITSLTIAMQRPKISAVQAGLLLLQRAKSGTWTLTVQLVALGQDIGLHLDCTNWSIPLWERRLRKRLAWALYMQDKWSAVIYGRPSHINSADWNVPLPTEDDFEDIPSVDDADAVQLAKGRTIFMEFITLTNIMAEVCDTFYSEKSKAECTQAGRYATQLVLNRAKPVQIKLKDWFARLPAECKMDSSVSSGASSPSNTHPTTIQGHLHLAYFATEISIHRRIVQSLDPQTADPYLLYICRSAAKTRLISALDFVNRLTPQHLSAFWSFASASNFALIGTFGALLQASSPGKEEAWFYACRLREFRWTLGVSAVKAPWIGVAVDLLDANTEMLTRLPEKPSVSESSMVELSNIRKTGILLPEKPKQELADEFDDDEEDEDDEDEEMEGQDDEDMDVDEWSSEIGRSISTVSG